MQAVKQNLTIRHHPFVKEVLSAVRTSHRLSVNFSQENPRAYLKLTEKHCYFIMLSFSYKYKRMPKKCNFLLFIEKILKAETHAVDTLDNMSMKLQYLHVYIMRMVYLC